MGKLNYPKWTLKSLTKRVSQYAGYVGCGCYKWPHDPKTKSCARADFVRLAKELRKRAREPHHGGRQ